jgi:hypothetical protein
MSLKAWRIDCHDYDMLVFARTRNRARRMVVESGPDNHEYQYVRAVRHKSLDRFADRENLMCCNAELPAGCPPFWSES